MGNSTGSTMYMFGAVIVIYIAGMLLYQGFQVAQEKEENRKKTKNSEEVTNSVDIIIVLIVIVLLGFALKGSIKHFKGESPCCGGGSGEIVLDIPDKKLENPILGKKVLKFPVCTANIV